jgi:signal recognition particle subunit SEC65
MGTQFYGAWLIVEEIGLKARHRHEKLNPRFRVGLNLRNLLDLSGPKTP